MFDQFTNAFAANFFRPKRPRGIAQDSLADTSNLDPHLPA
jgi:hypothetical protein